LPPGIRPQNRKTFFLDFGRIQAYTRNNLQDIVSRQLPGLAGFVEEIHTLSNVPRPDSILRIGNVVIPGGYRKLEEPLEAFFGDEERTCRVIDKNVFIMTVSSPATRPWNASTRRFGRG
jgi:hypothetical protein